MCVCVFQTVKPEYKERLSNVSNLVLVMFANDTMVQPKESEVSLSPVGHAMVTCWSRYGHLLVM